MSTDPNRATAGHPLRQAITGVGYFTLAFGTIVGSGWVVVLGEWLAVAGPGGALVGFAMGGVMMAVVALAYAELAARLPRAGGEFLFVLNGLGRTAGFLTGWFLTLYIVGFTGFEALVLAWFIEMLFPVLASAPVLYKIHGYDVTAFNLSLGIVGAISLTFLNCLGARTAVSIHKFITFAFIGISLSLVVLGISQGRAVNLLPLFSAEVNEGGSVLSGMFWVFATALLFLSGFQTTVNAVEERTGSFRSIAFALVGAVLAAAIFYCLIIISASALVPWRDLFSQPLPAMAAFGGLLGGTAGNIVLIAATVSLIKTWNALHLGASRLILAQAREGFLPASLSTVDPKRGVPTRAIVLVGLITIAWLFLGRGAILVIVNMSTVCITLAMILSIISLIRLRRSQTVVPAFVMPGGDLVLAIAILVAVVAAVVAIIAPFEATEGMPVEAVLFLIWLALGLVLRTVAAKRTHGRQEVTSQASSNL